MMAPSGYRTFATGAESTSGDLVAQLTTLLAAELLIIFTSEETLILIHVGLVLLGLGHVREQRSGGWICLSGSASPLTHLLEETGDALLNKGVATTTGVEGSVLALLHVMIVHLLLTQSIILLLMLGSISSHRRPLMIHTGLHATDLCGWTSPGQLVCAESVGVNILGHLGVGEEQVRGVVHASRFNVQLRWAGGPEWRLSRWEYPPPSYIL